MIRVVPTATAMRTAKKEIHVGLNVAKYHFGKVKFEQMQPAVFLICST